MSKKKNTYRTIRELEIRELSMYMGHYYLKNSTSVKSMFKKVYYLHLAIVEGTTSSSFLFFIPSSRFHWCFSGTIWKCSDLVVVSGLLW